MLFVEDMDNYFILNTFILWMLFHNVANNSFTGLHRKKFPGKVNSFQNMI